MPTDPAQAAYDALWDSDQRMRIMAAVSAGFPLIVAAGSPLARAELAAMGPQPSDWMLLEAGIDCDDLEDGLWVIDGTVCYCSPIGLDPDVSGASHGVTIRRPTVDEVGRLAAGRCPWEVADAD